MIDIVSLLRNVTLNESEYNAFCPVCEQGKTTGDKHLYFSIEPDKILMTCYKDCTIQAICSALNIDESDLFENAEKSQRWQFIREHVYYNADGEPIAQKKLYRKPDGSKTGIWYRRENNGYILKLNGMKPPMYNAPILSRTREGDLIYIVEGEKDADTLLSIGIVAPTTTPNGAGQAKIPDTCIQYFVNRTAVIMGDNDEPGKKYADILYNTLRKTARQVIKIDPVTLWADLPYKGDISDICEHYGAEETREKLDIAVKDAIFDDMYSRNYMHSEDNGHSYKVTVPLLHKYISEHEKIISARASTKGTIQRYIYKNGVYVNISDDNLKGIISDYLPILNHSSKTVNECFALFTHEHKNIIRLDDLDTDANVINFENGLLSLATLQLLPHTPDIYSTIQIPCKYNKDAHRPSNSVFERYMDTLTDGDREKREVLLQVMGITLSNVPGYKMKKALFMIGPGDSGKSQLKALMVLLIGSDHFSGIDIEELEKPHGTSQVYNKRLAGSSDMGYCTVKGLHIFQQLTGGDDMTAEFKYEQGFPFKFKGVLWFCANKLPRFGGDKGDHIYNRILIVTCANVICQEKQDSNILEKMYAEREYIVKLSVDAARRVIANKYKYSEPESSRIEMKKYKRENNSVLTFLAECCEERNSTDINDIFSAGYIYRMYSRWCDINNGRFKENNDIFTNTIELTGNGKTRELNGYTFYINIVPTRVANEQYGDIYKK